MIDSFNLGVASEFIVAGILIERGYEVLLPFDRRGRYDLGFIHNGEFKRIQVKRANWIKPAHTTSEYLRVMTSSHGRKYNPEEVDFFAFIDPDHRVWLVPSQDINQMILTLDKRVKNERNWSTKQRFQSERYQIA